MPDNNAAAHWRQLAADKIAWAEYQESRGEYSEVSRLNAKLYEDTARAIELTEEHGEPYCACHLRPMREMREIDARVKRA